jgi:hypothetical protein
MKHVHMLAFRPQRLAGRRENAGLWCFVHNALRQLRYRIDDMLAVVEHKKSFSVAEKSEQVEQWVFRLTHEA